MRHQQHQTGWRGRPIKLRARPGFQRLLRDQRFTVGAPHLGPITGQWIAALIAPIWSDARTLSGAAELPLDLNGLDAGSEFEAIGPDRQLRFYSLQRMRCRLERLCLGAGQRPRPTCGPGCTRASR